jgi:hypothetical protein
MKPINNTEGRQLKDIEYQITLNNERISIAIGFILLCVIIF